MSSPPLCPQRPPFQICGIQVVLNKHVMELNQPSCSLSPALLGWPCGGAIGDGSVAAILSVLWSAWVTKKEPGPSASALWWFPLGR